MLQCEIFVIKLDAHNSYITILLFLTVYNISGCLLYLLRDLTRHLITQSCRH